MNGQQGRKVHGFWSWQPATPRTPSAMTKRDRKRPDRAPTSFGGTFTIAWRGFHSFLPWRRSPAAAFCRGRVSFKKTKCAMCLTFLLVLTNWFVNSVPLIKPALGSYPPASYHTPPSPRPHLQATPARIVTAWVRQRESEREPSGVFSQPASSLWALLLAQRYV